MGGRKWRKGMAERIDQASAIGFIFPLVYIPPKNKKQKTITNSNAYFFRRLSKSIVSILNRYIQETRFNKYIENLIYLQSQLLTYRIASPTTLSLSKASSDVLPQYLKVLGSLRVTLYIEHSGCYTGANMARYLARLHSIKARRVREILDFIKNTGPITSCSSNILKPAHRGRPISGLPIHNSYCCNAVDYNFLTVNLDSIKQHCFKLHGQKRKLNKSIPYRAAKLQTLQVKTQDIDYFVIIPPASRSGSSSSSANGTVNSSKTPLLSATEAESGWNALQIWFKEAQDKRAERYSQVQVPAHILEITPWLKSTRYYIHLTELNVEELPQSYRLPDAQDKQLLATVCASIERVLQKVMGIMEDNVLYKNRRLNRLNAKLLNMFRGAKMLQDPIKPLQNKRSATTYIQTWQKLTCYFYRVKDGKYLRKDLFRPTERQLKYAGNIIEAANEVKLREEQDREGGRVGTEEAMDKLDKLALELSLAFI